VSDNFALPEEISHYWALLGIPLILPESHELIGTSLDRRRFSSAPRHCTCGRIPKYGVQHGSTNKPHAPYVQKIKVIKVVWTLTTVLTHSHRNRTWTVRFGSFSNSRTVASRMLCYTQSAHFVDSTKWASIRRRIQADTPENHGHLKVPKQSLLSLLQVCGAAHREGSWAETLESLCTDCCQRETKKFKEECSKKFGNEWCSHGYTSVRSLHSRFRDSQILIFDISMQKSHGYHGL